MKTSTRPTLSDALEKIVGRALSSVTFVADYVQMAFDGPCLTAYTLPVVSSPSESLKWGDFGYRDALCAQIGRCVKRIQVDDRSVSIQFEGDAQISVSLLDRDYVGPEALQFSLNNEMIWVV